MVNTKRGKPQKWSDEDLKQIALEVKYKQPNRKIFIIRKRNWNWRNTWSRRMKEFINHLNSPIYIPKLDESGIITIPSVEELFLKYGANTTELKMRLQSY